MTDSDAVDGGSGAGPQTAGADRTEDGDLREDFDRETAARGAVYSLVAGLFTDPSPERYEALASGAARAELAGLVERSGLNVDVPDLTVEEDREMVSARYNDLFVVGYSEVIDGTDGTVENQGPPVSLYESDYRQEVSWNDVNLDLARAYEYFGCAVDADQRRHHDHLRLQLEFAGYLCRREAAVDPGIARARMDFHDRHLRVVVPGVADALDREPGTGIYGDLADFLDRFSEADLADLADRLTGGDGT